MTSIRPPPPAAPAEQRVVLDNISWSTYLAILEDAEDAENRRGRICYDQGALEILAPSMRHEITKHLIARMIEAFTEERAIDISAVGSTTFKREGLKRGFEADEAYYVAHASSVRGKSEVDLEVDPPPDLVVEVDISRSSMGKLAIFGSLGIPEVWRFDGLALRVHVLRADAYVESPESRVLSGFPMEDAARVLEQHATTSETELIRSFRCRVRQLFESR